VIGITIESKTRTETIEIIENARNAQITDLKWFIKGIVLMSK
jgi:hypothetical protein